MANADTPNPNELNPGTDSPEEFQELATLVAEALAKGDSREIVIEDLTKNGWEPDAAHELVSSVENAMRRHQQNEAQASAGGEGMGWLLWIGVLLVVNFLSWALDWGFWLY